MIVLSENVKPRFDSLAGLGPRPTFPGISASGVDVAAPAAAPVDDAEAAMRKALGLLSEPPRHRPEPEQTETPARLPERSGAGWLHRRRFVKDGDVPVTVLRREPAHDAAARRAVPAAVPTSSRLRQVEAALANETAARVQAERALADAQAAMRDLQTKAGHIDLAKDEAQAALRREREVLASLRQELEAIRADAEAVRLRAAEVERSVADHEDLVAEERQARRSLEKSLGAAEAARDEAEALARTLSEDVSEPVTQVPLSPAPAQAPVVSAPRKRDRPAVSQPLLPALEPEPVKWWLTPSKPVSRRR